MTWGGYWLARMFPAIFARIHILVIVIIVLSCVPIAIEIYRERRKAAKQRA